ncbi:MAG: hypothetical protein ABIZ91_09505 [Gemmatimonadaceae bacterium]
MSTVGIVGGLGVESTLDYYRCIVEVWAQHDPSASPAIVINSLDFQRGLRLISSDLPAPP